MKFLFSMVLLMQVGRAFAQDANSCDSTASHLARRDLVVKSISFQEKNYTEPFEEVKLRVQNVGNITLSGTSSLAWMKVKVKGHVRRIAVHVPLAPGQIDTVYVNLDPGTLKHCEKVAVSIDLEHTVGQKGCQVWNNDTGLFVAFKANAPMLCPVVAIP